MVPLQLATALAKAGRSMDMRGWVPGSAGNLSARLNESQIAITKSGIHKGKIRAKDDIIVVDYQGVPIVDGQRPSAETVLHCQIYRLFPPAGAVLHGHSVSATVLSRLGPIIFTDYELLKAFGFTTHEVEVNLPIYENDQDIPQLAKLIEPDLLNQPPIGYVLKGHGVYTWGTSIEHALWRLEALEFLMECELKRRQVQ